MANCTKISRSRLLWIAIAMIALVLLMLRSRSCVQMRIRVKSKTVCCQSHCSRKSSSLENSSFRIVPMAIAGTLPSKPSPNTTSVSSKLNQPLRNNYIDFRAGAGDFPHSGHFSGNVGNLRFSERNPWQGQITPPSRGFCRFKSNYYGLRATCKTLLSYQKAGIVSYGTIISRYAPPFENDTDLYCRVVCHSCGVTPTDMVNSTWDIVRLSIAIVFMETNYRPSLDEIIKVYDDLRPA